jgi:hypothetical protein
MSPSSGATPAGWSTKGVVRRRRCMRALLGETDRPDGRAGTSAFAAKHSPAETGVRHPLVAHMEERMSRGRG